MEAAWLQGDSTGSIGGSGVEGTWLQGNSTVEPEAPLEGVEWRGPGSKGTPKWLGVLHSKDPLQLLIPTPLLGALQGPLPISGWEVNDGVLVAEERNLMPVAGIADYKLPVSESRKWLRYLHQLWCATVCMVSVAHAIMA